MGKQKNTSKKEIEIIHVLSVSSESGDDYGPYLFRKQPTDEELFAFLLKYIEQECNDLTEPDEDEGPGFGGTNLHIRWSTDRIH